MSFIVMENVHYIYAKAGQETLKGISLILNRDDAVALMGPNGSGKTTLGKIAVKIYRPSQGRVLLKGRDLADYTLGQVGKHIGYVFQNPEKQLFSPSVEEEISFALRFRGLQEETVQERVHQMLLHFDLLSKRKLVPFNLSQGEKQRVAMAAAFALEPDFMIFDEPTTGLDVKRKQKLLELLYKARSRGAGYLLISHDEEFCKKACDRFLYLKDGRLL